MKGIYPSMDAFVMFFGQIFFRIFLIRVMQLDDYGKFVIIMSIADLMGILISFFDKSFLKFYSADDDKDFISITILWKLLSTFVTFVVVLVFSGPITGVFNNVFDTYFLFFIPIVLFAGIVRTVTRLYFESKLKFKSLFLYNLFDMLLVNLSIVAVSFTMGVGVASVFYILSLCYFIVSLVGFGVLVSNGFLFGGFTLKGIKAKFVNMFNFGKYSFGLSASLIFSNQADSLILAMFMTPREVSLYDAAKKIVPAARTVSTTFSKVLFPKLSALKGDIVKSKFLFEKFLKYGLYGGGCAAFLNFIFAPFYVPLLYGENFAPAVGAVMLNSLYFLIHPVANISGNTLAALNNPKKDFHTWIVSSCLNVIFNLILIPQFSFYGAVISALLTILSASIMNSFKVKKILCFSWNNIIKP